MRNFSQMITNLRDSENALYDALVETVGYVFFQYHANNRKADGKGNAYWPQIMGAIQTKWVAERISKLEPKGKRIADIADETQAMMMVAPEISRILNERKQENAAKTIARNRAKADKLEAERQARVNAYQAEQESAGKATVDVQINSPWALLDNGKAIELTRDEYVAIQGLLAQMRTAKMLKAA